MVPAQKAEAGSYKKKQKKETLECFYKVNFKKISPALRITISKGCSKVSKVIQTENYKKIKEKH
jgi:hypothetical protein